MLFKTRKMKKPAVETEEKEQEECAQKEPKEDALEERMNETAKSFNEMSNKYPLMLELTFRDPGKPDMLPLFCDHVAVLPVVMNGGTPEIFIVSTDENGNKLHPQMQFAMMGLWVRELSLDEDLAPHLRALCESFWDGMVSETLSAYGVNTKVEADPTLN